MTCCTSYWGAWHAWHRYGRRIESTLGEVVTGGCPIDYPRAFLREMDQLRGKPRVWLLFGRNQVAEEQALRLAYLDTIGDPQRGAARRRAAHQSYGKRRPVPLRLQRLFPAGASQTAESFPIPASLVKREVGCRRFDAMMRRADGTRVVPLF